MNLFTIVPSTWKPNDTEALNEWFLKIHNKKYVEFLNELETAIKN